MDPSMIYFPHMALSPPLLPGLQITGMPEDQGFWEEYFKKVTDEDIRLMTRWQKILDTLLVYVGLFIGVLTAFIIQVSTVFQPSPGDSTNKILIAIYNHTMNASTPIDLQQDVIWGKAFNWTLSTSVYLLYISLAVSVIEAAFALFISIWLTRYQRSLTTTGPTIHERIRLRQENYQGLMEWRLPMLIEILPIVALVALAFFALFIRLSVWEAYPAVGDILDNIFIAASIIFVLSASFAAFIPGAPFHSPLSGAIRFIFQVFPNRSIGGIIRIRTVCVIVISITLALHRFFKTGPNWILWIVNILLQFFVPVSLLSLCQGTRAKKEAQKHPNPRLFSLASWLYFHFIVITTLSFMIPYMRIDALAFLFFFLKNLDLFVMTVGAVMMSRWPPDEGKAKAEAIAWIIKTQHPHNPFTFQNAVEIARSSAHLRSTLLNDILPVLDVIIKSIRGDSEKDLGDEKMYITLLAVLLDFEPCEASFWRNEAAMRRPVLSDGLKEKLLILRTGCAGHTSPQAGCTSVEADFILGKVGMEGMLEKSSC